MCARCFIFQNDSCRRASSGEHLHLGVIRHTNLTFRPTFELNFVGGSWDRDASVGAVETLVAAHCAQGGMAVVSTHLPMRLPGEATLALEAAGGARAA